MNTFAACLIILFAILIVVVEHFVYKGKFKPKDDYRHPHRDRFWDG